MSIPETETATAAAAATPILASTLLAGSRTTSWPLPGTGSRKEWDLREGIFDDDSGGGGDLFGRKGVLGISGLKDNDSDVGELGLWMLVRFLSSARSNSSTSSSGEVDGSTVSARRAFIIHPAHSTTFAPERMLSGILSIIGTEAGNDDNALAHHLLSRTEILRVFDFEEMMQAVSEVSERIYCESKESDEREDVVVIIEGVDRFTKSVIEKSNVTRGNALLNVLLKRLGILSRGDGHGNGNEDGRGVRVLIVNEGIGVGGLGGGAGSGGEKGGEGKRLEPTARDDIENSEVAPTDSLQQSEKLPNSNQQSKSQRQNRHPSSIFLYNHVSYARPWGLYLTFNKSLDQGIDTHLLISRVQGQKVVEVAKDRVGDDVGRWCVWG